DRVLPGIVCVHRQTAAERLGERGLKGVVMGIEVIAVIGNAVGPAALTWRETRWSLIGRIRTRRELPGIVSLQKRLVRRRIVLHQCSAREDTAFGIRDSTWSAVGTSWIAVSPIWIEVQGLASDAVLCGKGDRCFHRVRRIAAPVGKSVGALVAHVGDRERERRRQGLLEARVPCIEGRKTERVGSGA